jgi:hypothetical protein
VEPYRDGGDSSPHSEEEEEIRSNELTYQAQLIILFDFPTQSGCVIPDFALRFAVLYCAGVWFLFVGPDGKNLGRTEEEGFCSGSQSERLRR